MIVKTGQDMPHVQHVIGDIDARDDQRNQVINLRLFILFTLSFGLLTFPELLVRNQSHFSRDREVPHT